jgi:hypothetical protein
VDKFDTAGQAGSFAKEVFEKTGQLISEVLSMHPSLEETWTVLGANAQKLGADPGDLVRLPSNMGHVTCIAVRLPCSTLGGC